MTQLIMASLIFLGLHVVPSTPLRGALIDRLGEKAYMGLFSLGSALSLAWMLWAYGAAEPAEPLWVTGELWRWVTAGLMLVAFILMVAGVATPNPLMVMGDAALDREAPWSGIFAITRHPVMWGTGLWALLHLSNKPDAVSAVLFGSLALLAIAGSKLQEIRKARELGEAWTPFAAHTSFWPFAAMLGGRARLRLSELGWWRIGLAVLLWAVLLHFHGVLFGVSPLPI